MLPFGSLSVGNNSDRDSANSAVQHQLEPTARESRCAAAQL